MEKTKGWGNEKTRETFQRHEKNHTRKDIRLSRSGTAGDAKRSETSTSYGSLAIQKTDIGNRGTNFKHQPLSSREQKVKRETKETLKNLF